MPRKYQRQPNSKPPGQPTVMTEAIQQKIVDHIAGGGTIKSYCKKHKYPNPDTVFNFLASERGEKFSELVSRAREYGTHAIAEQCIKIADDLKIDPLHKRIMVDVRLRLIAQWNRKAYGVKPELNQTQRLTLGELVEAAIEHGKQLDALPRDVTPLLMPPSKELVVNGGSGSASR